MRAATVHLRARAQGGVRVRVRLVTILGLMTWVEVGVAWLIRLVRLVRLAGLVWLRYQRARSRRHRRTRRTRARQTTRAAFVLGLEVARAGATSGRRRLLAADAARGGAVVAARALVAGERGCGRATRAERKHRAARLVGSHLQLLASGAAVDLQPLSGRAAGRGMAQLGARGAEHAVQVDVARGFGGRQHLLLLRAAVQVFGQLGVERARSFRGPLVGAPS